MPPANIFEWLRNTRIGRLIWRPISAVLVRLRAGYDEFVHQRAAGVGYWRALWRAWQTFWK